jgi:hypothetical protein
MGITQETVTQEQMQGIQTHARNLNTQLMVNQQVKTGRPPKMDSIHDMMNYYYPYQNNPNYFSDLKKIDDPVLSDTTNFLVTTYGAMLFSQLDLEDNIWKFLPKTTWDRRGWRMLTARHQTGGGLAEDGDLPETDMADVGIGSAAPKTIVHTFDASAQAILEGDTADDSYGNPLDAQRPIVGQEHTKDMNAYLTQDADTLAGVNLESIDRLTIDTATVTALSYTADDEDIFGIDRSAVSWADPYSDHNSGSDRDFSLGLVDDLLKSVRRYQINSPGGQGVFITGEDTYERWNRELAPQQRFDDKANVARISTGLNGVQPIGDRETGFEIATYRKYPVVISNDVAQDTLSRIYFLWLGQNATNMKVLAPTQYYEAGWSHGDPFILNKLGTEGAFVTFCELNCKNFPANGSIRDLK